MPPTKKPDTWRTREGQVIPIKDLEDAHLENIIDFYVRNRVEPLRLQLLGEAYSFQGQCRGDGAFDAIENEIHNLDVMEDEDLLVENDPLFAALYAEWRKRK